MNCERESRFDLNETNPADKNGDRRSNSALMLDLHKAK